MSSNQHLRFLREYHCCHYVYLLFIFFLSYLNCTTLAKLTLSTIFSDNLILPAKPLRANIFGKTTSGKNVKIQVQLELCSKTTTISTITCVEDIRAEGTSTNENGAFEIVLPEREAIEFEIGSNTLPQFWKLTITDTSDSSTLKFNNILFGDIYFATGQSNLMFGTWKAREFAKMKSEASKYPHLRMYSVKFDIDSAAPTETIEGVPGFDGWKISSDALVQGLNRNAGTSRDVFVPPSAVAYSFGKGIQDILSQQQLSSSKKVVPIGIIVSVARGAGIISWISKNANSDPTCTDVWLDTSQTALKWGSIPRTRKSHLWNAIVYPLLRFPVRGYLWYHGSYDRQVAEQFGDKYLASYACLQKAMIRDYRNRWQKYDKVNGIGNFITVSAHPAKYRKKFDQEKAVVLFRIAQASPQYDASIDGAGIIPTYDMGDTNGIGIGNHPAKKSEIGRRAAFMMTNLTYGNMAINVASTGPTMYSPYYDVANDKNHLYLEFKTYNSAKIIYHGTPSWDANDLTTTLNFNSNDENCFKNGGTEFEYCETDTTPNLQLQLGNSKCTWCYESAPTFTSHCNWRYFKSIKIATNNNRMFKLETHEDLNTKYVKVRYAFADAPSCAIYSNGLPGEPFMMYIDLHKTGLYSTSSSDNRTSSPLLPSCIGYTCNAISVIKETPLYMFLLIGSLAIGILGFIILFIYRRKRKQEMSPVSVITSQELQDLHSRDD